MTGKNGSMYVACYGQYGVVCHAEDVKAGLPLHTWHSRWHHSLGCHSVDTPVRGRLEGMPTLKLSRFDRSGVLEFQVRPFTSSKQMVDHCVSLRCHREVAS